MALATGPFTQNFNPGTPTPKALLLAQASDGDAEALVQLVEKATPGGLFVSQTGTITAATTGVFTLGATAAAALALVGSPGLGDGVTITVECFKIPAVVGAADAAHYFGASATVLNVAGTLTIVGAVTAGDQTHEGTAGDGGVLTIAAGIPTYTVTQANAVTAALRCQWFIKSLSGAF